MKTFELFLATLLLVAMTPTAHAAPWKILFQDQKMPTQASLEHDSWATPIAASATYVVSGGATVSGQAKTFTTFAHQPDYARNVTITPAGTTANVNAGTAVVSGTNIFGQAISEDFAIASTQSSATTGNKAFKTITSVLFPAPGGSGVTVNVGVGSKLGIRRCLDDAGKYVFSEIGGAFETTRGTAAVNATAVESNTFVPNGSMDGSTAVDLFYVQNFRCF